MYNITEREGDSVNYTLYSTLRNYAITFVLLHCTHPVQSSIIISRINLTFLLLFMQTNLSV